MKPVRKAVLALLAWIAGLAVTFIGVVAVEAYSSVVHPFPADFDGSHLQVCAHVGRYPAWVLASAIPMWAAAAFAGVWAARRIGSFVPAIALGVFLLACVAFNVSMLPYPTWFSIGSLIAVAIASLAAARTERMRAAVGPTVENLM